MSTPKLLSFQHNKKEHKNNAVVPSSLAVLGTMSDAGKSSIVSGICRILSNNGRIVAPFKAQNMSNNSHPALITHHNDDDNGDDDTKARCCGWGEIGMAQAVQAEACRIIPRVEMNPVLLKSGGRNKDGEYLCSVLVCGKHISTEDFGTLGNRTKTLKSLAVEAHKRLGRVTGAEVIVMEGAGSCTELNLMDRDIVNVPLVREIQCPWILVANIDPGGVFAQVVGTKACLSEEDWGLCRAVIINKLRGEAKYFEPGPRMIEEMVGKRVFVVPFMNGFDVPEEDGLGVERRLAWENEMSSKTAVEAIGKKKRKREIVVVLAYPHISITSDITPLERDDRYEVIWMRHSSPPPPYPKTRAVVLPGSRLTRSDLQWLQTRHDWVSFLREHVSLGGVILGVCGGYQMLGLAVSDPNGVEGQNENDGNDTTDGLGFLPIRTVIEPAHLKVVTPRTGQLLHPKTNPHSSPILVKGFELHCGRSSIVTHQNEPQKHAPLLHLNTDDHDHGEYQEEGLRLGHVFGTYLHGILHTREARTLVLGENNSFDDSQQQHNENGIVDDPLDKFAKHLESCGLDYETIMGMLS